MTDGQRTNDANMHSVSVQNKEIGALRSTIAEMEQRAMDRESEDAQYGNCESHGDRKAITTDSEGYGMCAECVRNWRDHVAAK